MVERECGMNRGSISQMPLPWAGNARRRSSERTGACAVSRRGRLTRVALSRWRRLSDRPANIHGRNGPEQVGEVRGLF